MKSVMSALIFLISIPSFAIQPPSCHDAGLKYAEKWRANIQQDITHDLKKVLIDAFASAGYNHIGEQTGWVCNYSLHVDANGYISNKNQGVGGALGGINHKMYKDEIQVPLAL